MLLTSAGRSEGPIPPETRRVAGLLAREKTGDILAHLFRRPYLSASEIARLEDIHVATAQRYLKELAEAGLVGARTRDTTTRPTEEYWLLDPHITIQIDLQDGAGGDGLAEAARRIAVRDRGPANVVYDTNPRTGEVEGILILSDDQPRLVEDRIRLTAAVGRFLSQLPYSAGRLQSVWTVMQDAGLHEEHLAEVLGAIGRFTAPAPTQADPALVPDASSGAPTQASERPLDPEMEALFRSLAARHDRPGSPPLHILEVLPFEPSSNTTRDHDETPPDDAAPESDAHPVAPESTT